jgi:hypothetical protein
MESSISAMDELDEQFKENSREYEAEQPSLCESIAMGVASSGLLGGSAPVNIPRSGLERHPPRLTPSPTTLSLLSNIRVGGHDHMSVDSSNNSSSLFFNRVRRQSLLNCLSEDFLSVLFVGWWQL